MQFVYGLLQTFFELANVKVLRGNAAIFHIAVIYSISGKNTLKPVVF